MEDLFRITNYYDHPTDNRYMVIHYFKKEQADLLTKKLEEKKIVFEYHVEEQEEKTIYMFGVHKKFKKDAEHLNFLVIGTTRQPFINNRSLRVLIFVVLGIVLSLTVLGLLYSKK